EGAVSQGKRFAFLDNPYPAFRDRLDYSVGLVEDFGPVNASGAGDQPRRVDDVPPGTGMGDDGGVRTMLHQLRRAAAVVEVDVSDDGVTDLLRRQPLLP